MSTATEMLKLENVECLNRFPSVCVSHLSFSAAYNVTLKWSLPFLSDVALLLYASQTKLCASYIKA